MRVRFLCAWPRSAAWGCAKFALIKHQRYAHAKQFGRANRSLKKLKTYLGRVIRDIGRKIEGHEGLEAAFARCLSLARRVRDQKQHQRGEKIYSLHAPEVEARNGRSTSFLVCVKVSVATTLSHPKRSVRHPCEGDAGQAI